MVLAADSSTSPRFSKEGVNSPQSRNNSPCTKLQIVISEPESINSMREQSNDFVVIDGSDNKKGNAGKGKKPAWNKPTLNGVAEIVSPVIDASSWPALSESTKPSPKSSQVESSSRAAPDGSMSTSQGPVIAHSPKKQANTNANSNLTTNHTLLARQRSMKRGGGGGSGSISGGGHSQSSFTHPPPPPPPPPPFPIFGFTPNGYANLVPAMPDQSPREPPYRGNSWESRPAGGYVNQSAVATDHRHSSRRGNFGPRGDGLHRNNVGGRRDQDHGHHGSARDVHVQPQRAPPRGFVRPMSPNSGAFIPPQPVRPFAAPIGFPDMFYTPMTFDPYTGVPLIPHGPPPPMPITFSEPPLPVMLVRQIEYYFSDSNLFKDDFLKSKMDDQGWVPITLIASFNRVKSMTNNIQFIMESLRASTVLEIQDDKVRRRNDWMNWLPSSTPLPTDLGGAQSSGISSSDTLTTSFQKMAMEESAAGQDSTTAESHGSTFQAQISHQEGTEGTTSSS